MHRLGCTFLPGVQAWAEDQLALAAEALTATAPEASAATYSRSTSNIEKAIAEATCRAVQRSYFSSWTQISRSCYYVGHRNGN